MRESIMTTASSAVAIRPSRGHTIAAIFIPVPYILSHDDLMAGPRLPYDGILLCFAAFALVSLIPGAVRGPEPVAKPVKEK